MTWLAVLAGTAGCYLAKLAGLSLPPRLLANARVQRVAALLPVALLAALASTQTVTTGTSIVLDARTAGLAVAVLAVLRRAPFIVVVAAAVLSTSLVRLVS
ncbi:MAG: AzlD domain-containing protein [Jatrophihabitantaceae bacterium]